MRGGAAPSGPSLAHVHDTYQQELHQSYDKPLVAGGAEVYNLRNQLLECGVKLVAARGEDLENYTCVSEPLSYFVVCS